MTMAELHEVSDATHVSTTLFMALNMHAGVACACGACHDLGLSSWAYLMPAVCVQVWWYAHGVMRGKLVCHDLASGRTDELNPAGIPATVLCLHLDAENNIWAGHRGGLMQVRFQLDCIAPCCAVAGWVCNQAQRASVGCGSTHLMHAACLPGVLGALSNSRGARNGPAAEPTAEACEVQVWCEETCQSLCPLVRVDANDITCAPASSGLFQPHLAALWLPILRQLRGMLQQLPRLQLRRGGAHHACSWQLCRDASARGSLRLGGESSGLLHAHSWAAACQASWSIMPCEQGL